MFTTDTKAKIITFIKQNGSATNNKLRKLTGISKIGIAKHLKELRDSGQIIKDPQHFIYYLNHQVDGSVNTITPHAKDAANTITPQAQPTAGQAKDEAKTITRLVGDTVKTIPHQAKGASNTITRPVGGSVNTITSPTGEASNTITPQAQDVIVFSVDRLAKDLKSHQKLVYTELQRLKQENADLRSLLETIRTELGGLKATMTTFKVTIEPPKPPAAPLPVPVQSVQPAPIQAASVQQAPYRPTGSSTGQAAPKQTIAQPKHPPEPPVVTFLWNLGGLIIFGFIVYWFFRGLGVVMVFVFQIIDWLFAHVRGF